MKHKLFILFICMMTTICANAQEVNDSTYNNQNPPPGYIELGLAILFDDPIGGQGGLHPAPPMAPHVYYNENTASLFFATSCEGCTLRLIPYDDEEEDYETVIASQILYLPQWLYGEYELQIVSGIFCFYTDLEVY